MEEVGYPFKNKEHAKKVEQYQRKGNLTKYLQEYVYGIGRKANTKYTCPVPLRYQFTDQCKLKISYRCCDELKKKPVNEYVKKTGRSVIITGMMREEGGARDHIQCVHFKNGRITKFHPLAKVTHEWEQWFIETYNIKLCKLYYEPYNFERTGCKGCPFALTLQEQLETMEIYMPNERKQCEYIWKPVYDEYRRLGYRLTSEEQTKLF